MQVEHSLKLSVGKTRLILRTMKSVETASAHPFLQDKQLVMIMKDSIRFCLQMLPEGTWSTPVLTTLRFRRTRNLPIHNYNQVRGNQQEHLCRSLVASSFRIRLSLDFTTIATRSKINKDSQESSKCRTLLKEALLTTLGSTNNNTSTKRCMVYHSFWNMT